MNAAPSPVPTRTALVVGFAAAYLIWGSTYLAIRFGVETLPPFLMASVRFLLPGLVMYALLRRRGAPRPTPAQWRGAAVTGTLLLLGGNGIVTWAEQRVPSGLTALIVASVPLWMSAMSWAVEPAARPHLRGVAGIILGFGGVAVLVEPGGDLGADGRTLLAALSIVVASALWAAGSLAARHADLPKSPFLATAMQMIVGAGALAVDGGVGTPRSHGRVREVGPVAGLSDDVRLRRRVERVCLASPGDHPREGLDVRLRESGRRRLPGVGAGGRAGHGTDCPGGHRDHPRRPHDHDGEGAWTAAGAPAARGRGGATA